MNGRQLNLGLKVKETESEKKERIKESKRVLELMLWLIGMLTSFVYGAVVGLPDHHNGETLDSGGVSLLIFSIILIAFILRIFSIPDRK